MRNVQFLAREGQRGAFFLVVLLVLCCLFGFKSLLELVLVLLVLWVFLFRNPERVIPKIKEAILAPCDGRITNITYQEDMVVLEMQISIYDVGIIRAPYASDELSIQRKFGFLSAFLGNEIKKKFNASVQWQSNYFSMTVYPEFLACKTYEGVDLYGGDRIGFCKSGILSLSMKQDFVDLKINIGDKIKSGETILGYKK